jgi:hypothetical protein
VLHTGQDPHLIDRQLFGIADEVNLRHRAQLALDAVDSDFDAETSAAQPASRPYSALLDGLSLRMRITENQLEASARADQRTID